MSFDINPKSVRSGLVGLLTACYILGVLSGIALAIIAINLIA